MSMSQEEIEALMSGADDILVDEIDESTNDEDILVEDLTHEDESLENDSIDEQEEINVDEILAGIDGIVEDDSTEEEINVDDILAGIEGITDDGSSVDDEPVASSAKEMDSKINSSQYPMPVSDENKVVNQLNEVADDSEEKASQIFDVLSFILDENAEISKYNKNMSEFIVKQIELLESLAVKFPNVSVFNENLDQANEFLQISKDLSAKVDGENNKVFEAMELMQYHDINRQKIERVMAVIRKLNDYLNGIFEDDSDKAEVQIAKHISGDSNDIVDATDIESLISEFSN